MGSSVDRAARATRAPSETERLDGASPVRKIAIIGFGNVGRALARRLLASHGWSGTRRWTVVAAFDSKGASVGPGGIDLAAALERKERDGHLEPRPPGPAPVREALKATRPDVVIELTRGGPVDGEPGTQHILDALHLGADVITANKSPIALHYGRIFGEARRVDREVRFGTTVGGVVPIVEASHGLLSTAGTVRVEAILNGTTQFVLEKLSSGATYPEAIAEAQRQGITEADPQWDLGGYDASLKATILHHCLFSGLLSPDAILRDGVNEGTVPAARQASSHGHRLVSITEITAEGARIHLQEVPLGSPWDAPGFENIFRVETRSAGTLWLQGLGAGPDAIAASLFADLESLVRFGHSSGRASIRSGDSLPVAEVSGPRRASPALHGENAPPRRIASSEARRTHTGPLARW